MILSFWNKFTVFEKKLFKFLFYCASFSLLVLLIFGYFKYTRLVPAFGGTYREGIVGSINHINPALSFNNNVERDLVKFFYPSLMVSSYEYGLAESSSVSEDQKEYFFSLKQNAKWEDGQPITADDVIFTFELIKNPLYKSPLKSNWDEVKIEKINDYQIKFILPNPYPLFLENLTTGILPKHIWENVAPEDFARSPNNLHPLSGGPYILKNIVRSVANNQGSSFKLSKIERIDLKRNKNYFGDQPFIDNFSLIFYNDEKQMLEALKNHRIDGALFTLADNFIEVQKLKNLDFLKMKFPRYYALFFNQTKSDTLKIEKIRQAIAMAIDRRELINKIFKGHAELVNSPIPSDDAFIVSDIDEVDFDIHKAKTIIESLLNTKNKLNLNLTLTVPKDDILLKVANFIKDSLERIGFAIKVESFDSKVLLESIIKERDYQMLLFGQALRVNPDPFSFWHSSQVKDPGLNLALYKNNSVDKILIEARQITDLEKRKQLYADFQKQILKDIPAVFLYRPIQLYAIKNSVKGISIPNLLSSPDERFNNVTRWYLKQKRVRSSQ